MTTIKIVDTKTGEETEREMNADELAQLEIDQANAATEKQAREEAALVKSALLVKLGITEQEAKLLLG